MKNSNIQVDQGENKDGLVTAPPTVGDDGTDERHGVNPESVEGTDSKGFLLTHTKSTGNTAGAVVRGNGACSRARRQLGTNVVVVDVGGS